MRWRLNHCRAFTQMSLGLILSCLPIAYLALTAHFGLNPGLGLFLVYCGLNMAVFWRLRTYPWLLQGVLFAPLNLIPLFFLSFQPAWAAVFGGGTWIATFLPYYIPPLWFAFDIMEQGAGHLPKRGLPKGLLSESALEMGALIIPWLLLGLMKILGLDPWNWALILYLAALLAIGRYYTRKVMIGSITRAEPVQSIFGIVVFTAWLYFFSFVLFYCFRDNPYYSLIYSEFISFNTVAAYYALMFGGFILLHLRHSAEINAAIEAEMKRRQACYEETKLWFKGQGELRAAEEAAGDIIEDGELAACYELAGLSHKAAQADLLRARQYWEGRYNPFLTGHAGPYREEEQKKIKKIRAALDKIARSLPPDP